MNTSPPRRRRAIAIVVPTLLVLACALFALLTFLPDDTDRPVDVTAEGPRFDRLEELGGASDIIVLGTVTGVVDGRVLTDPVDPDAGIRTQLATVEVELELVGDPDDPLVVEQEAELLDRTPVRVNGVGALVAGDRGLLFLVRGTSDEFPYTAFVNEQAWVPVTDDRLEPIDADDLLWADFAGRPTDDVLASLVAD